MVRIQGTSSPENKTKDSRPKPYRHSPDPIRHRQDIDPMRHREYKPTEFKPTYQQYEYKPYKPSHIGFYGEKQREKKPQQKPPTPKQSTQRIKKNKQTFDCYSDPKGPDIRLGDIGPEYPTTKYEPKEYKPTILNTKTNKKNSYVDPLKCRSVYMDQPTDVTYKGDVTYKLNEDNNAAMRHWNYGFVNDTVAAKGSTSKPKKYTVKEKPKPKTESKKPVESKPKTPEERKVEKKPEVKPVVAAVVPIQKASKAPTPPPPKKTFTSSSTQHVAPGVKTITTQTQDNKKTTSATQYESQKTKTTSIQTDTPTVPTPVIAPVPILSKTVQTRSEGIQCSETPKKVTVRGTQSDHPALRAQDTQTSPIVFATPHAQQAVQRKALSPEYVRQETPVYRAVKERTPPPSVVPIVVATSHKKTKSPQRRSPEPIQQMPPRKTPSPIPQKASPVVEKQKPPPKQPTPKIKTPQPQPPVSNSRWTPSPEVTETEDVYAAVNPPTRKSPKQTPRQEMSPKNDIYIPPKETPKSIPKSPKVFVPSESEKLPEAYAAPTVAKQPSPTQTWSRLFPSQPTRRRLPPEITACIEAYDCAHGPA